MSRGRPTIRDLIKQPPTSEERDNLRNTFAQMAAPPMVVAILGASFLEHELEIQLRSRFRRRDDKIWGRLVGENGALSTFSAKINASHAMGIVDDYARQNLLIVKNIRNAFAHSKKIIEFTNELVMDELANIEVPASNSGKRKKQYSELITEAKAGGRGPHYAFIMLCLMLHTDLLIKDAKRYKAKNRYHQKKAQKQSSSSPFFGSLANALLNPQKGSPAGALGLFGGSYPGDPISPNNLLTLSGILDAAKSEKAKKEGEE